MTEDERLDEYAFFSLEDEELASLGIDPLPVPVRRGREAEAFASGPVRMDILLVELCLFLEEFPGLTVLYAYTVETMSMLAGMNFAREGDEEAAARCLEWGLEYNPVSLTLRSNYAASLQLLGKEEEAAEQFRITLSDPRGRDDPVVCIMAARFHAGRGNYLEACHLLEGIAASIPPDDAFHDFLAEIRELAGVEGEAAAKASVGEETFGAAAPACPACGQALKPGARFCHACGAEIAVLKPGKTICPSCGKELEESLKFCNACGKPLQGEKQLPFCPGCGNRLRAGARFCRECGRKI